MERLERARGQNGRFVRREKSEEEKIVLAERRRQQNRLYKARQRARKRDIKNGKACVWCSGSGKLLKSYEQNRAIKERIRLQNLQAKRRYRDKNRDILNKKGVERYKALRLKRLATQCQTIVTISLASLEPSAQERFLNNFGLQVNRTRLFRPWE